MKKIIAVVVLLIVALFIGLNTGLISDQAEGWVKNNPKDSHAPDVLYKAARWCDLMGDNDRAVSVYMDLYQTYPQRGDLCAPALYHVADIQVEVTNSKARAKPYLEKIINEYPGEEEWVMKAKQLYDEANYAK